MTIDYKQIEEKWRTRWESGGHHEPDMARATRPFYNLMMFPYPSAEGLHVGNMFAFVGSDIQARYKKARGYDVFEPMGFDAFGMHSENHAIKTGQHPWYMVPKNINFFREQQLKRIGNMYDWRCQVDTTDPSYYRWTQWVFLQLFKAGLAYRKKAPVNWCPSCKTVLANEQAKNDECERCGSGVESRSMNQWFLRITNYADRLLANIDTIDWSDVTKRAQKNWIGRSDGAEIIFLIKGTGDSITVFTTRADTVFGATYIGVSEDHPLAGHLPENSAGLDTGLEAINPATGESIPIWTADYVLSGHGSGAVMGVPAHDKRDYEFAHHFGLKFKVVIEGPNAVDGPYTGEGILRDSGHFSGKTSSVARGEITEWLAASKTGGPATAYKLRDWCISRQRYWGTPIPIIHCDACGAVPVPDEHLPVELPYIKDFQPDGSGISPLARSASFVDTQCPTCGSDARRETDVCDNFLDSAWYFLRYPSHSNRQSPFDAKTTAKWLPVDLYIGGNEHAVLHLMYTRFVTMALHDLGHVPFEEPFKRFRAHGLIVKDGAKMSKSKGNVINPDNYIEAYGADVFRTYLMFSGNYLEGGDFRDENIVGIRRFFERVFSFCTDADFNTDEVDAPAQANIHRKIRKVTRDIANLRYNTAIAAIMELFTEIIKTPGRESVSILLRLLAPFAPFLTHELWEHLGYSGMIVEAEWPEYCDTYLHDNTAEYVIQINGKIRDRFTGQSDVSEEEIKRMAFAREKIKERLKDREPTRLVFVPGKLLNIVID